MSGAYAKAVREGLPGAEVCIDPFHVCQLAAGGRRRPPLRVEREGKVEDRGRKVGKGRPLVAAESARAPVDPPARRARRGLARQPPPVSGVPAQRGAAAALPPRRPPGGARALAAWLAWASRSKLGPFVKLARTIRHHRTDILAAIRLGLSNGRLEGLNSRVRLISHRSFGFHSAAPLIALVYLCCGGLVGTPPAA